MSSTNKMNDASENLWATRLDDLATRCMLEGPTTATLEALVTIKQDAESHGFEKGAGLADRLLALLRTDAQQGAAQLLETGITDLRSALISTPTSGSAPLPLADDPEMISDFLVEAGEHLAQIEGQMLALERDPENIEPLHTVFRAFHTIKGLAGFLDFAVIQSISHEVETLLDLARNRKLVVTPSVVDAVLSARDFLQVEASAIEFGLKSGTPVHASDPGPLIQIVRSLATGENSVSSMQTQNQSVIKEPSEQELFVTTPEMVPAFSLPHDEAAVPLREDEAISLVPAKEFTPSAPRSAPPSASISIRVDTNKLDALMNMVGELVIAQSTIRHNETLSAATDSRLIGDLSQLARITAEVQRIAMSIRMVPTGNLFSRVERVIRDISRKAGKQVLLQTSGTDTEIDKTVAEELADPLLHMIRNAIDHGIELPEERIAAGKSPQAVIHLSAFHERGRVVISISDDGRGLHKEKIRAKAEERGLIQSGVVLSDEKTWNLIFEPGFSTAEKITDLSGRGVGMDVVRKNVEKLRGRIETQSKPGSGTTFLLRLPLTLAIIDGLIVQVGTERFVIPLSSVREIFRPNPDTVFTVKEQDEMVLVRGQLMPVIRLHRQLRIAPRIAAQTDGLLVVVEADARRFCLFIDDLHGKQEIVIKNLGELFKQLPGFSGCAVLGDGHVGLILDIDAICIGDRR